MKKNQPEAVKFASFRDLGKAFNECSNSDKWNEFLKLKGHTPETFGILPEHLRNDLRFSFTRKQATK